MRVSKKVNSPTNIVLTVEAEASDLEPIRRHVLGHFKRSVRVPGFREGKAPLDMVEKHANQQLLMDEFMEHALNELYRRAVEQVSVRPLATPNVQLKKFVPYSQLEFEAETEILGTVKLPNYKAIKLAKPKISMTAENVNNVIKDLQTRMAQRTATTRPAKTGDELIIDFEGDDLKGHKVSGAEGKDFPLLLGSKTFIPGFEDNLIGVKAGQDKQFEVTFPADYSVASLQNKKVRFSVQVKKVQELKLPKADNQFAKKAGPFKDLAELKADIKRQLSEERHRQADIEFQNELMRKIAAKTEIEVPKSLVDEENLRLEDQEKQNLIYRGQTWKDHLEAEGISEAEHRERHYPEALERVKIGLILSEIAEREGVQITPEEIEVRTQLLKAQYQDPQMQAELDKPENQREVHSRLLTEKTLAKLVEYATAK